MTAVLSGKVEIEQVLRDVRALVFDMDGVLYRGNTRLPHVRELLAELDRRGLPYAMVTNNSTRTPAQYAEKLAGMGISTPPDRILTSSLVTRAWLEQQYPPGTRIYIVGMASLQQAILGDGHFAPAESDAEVVVSGADFSLTYDKLRIATLAIRRGAHYVATNPDKTFPSEEGLIPGAGAIIAALVAATDVTPVVIGKPEPAIMLQAAALLGVEPAQVLAIGDRLDTDVLAGQRAGFRTALVLTGVATLSDVDDSHVRPDLVLPNLEPLVDYFREERS
ncbi:HAD-IIA family hydrolase [Thermomicrobiaceae bacterium CFH 74404]|uniref:HAD-IIA family hydrolase n=1 Tax=Thermalbibacter longus TaxID=2951981 RepID=A0AA41WGS8_9BACT|nr:HAD-IIA family hydrolase [Thermalbibacter longus]MCM8750145.1 HAD-IIA family hydrolase [Thermalbibacter longus]